MEEESSEEEIKKEELMKINYPNIKIIHYKDSKFMYKRCEDLGLNANQISELRSVKLKKDI